MKTPQKTKEQLIKELGEITSKNEHLKNNDQYIREEFAKAFRWGSPRKSGMYEFGRNSVEEWDWKTPNWEQIFVEIGKLKSLMDYRDFDGNVSELECKLEDLEKRLLKNVNPNL